MHPRTGWRRGSPSWARGGVDGVRIEVLAERLGITGSGFYRRFKDRRALLNAMLKSWRDGRVTAIERQAEEGAATPAGKLGSILKLYSERANTQGIAIELAIRQWARSDPIAADAAGQVDAARLKTVSSLFRALGLSRRPRPRRAPCFSTHFCSARAFCFSTTIRAGGLILSPPAPGC